MATDWFMSIGDGTTVASFADGSGGATTFKIADDSWAPMVAGLRTGLLGGRSAYDDVTEEMDINVTGASIAACLANLATLAGLLDQADRWSRGEAVTAVLIKFSPKGATVSTAANPLQAAILGGSLSLPTTFDNLTHNAYVVRARLTLLRRGLWLANTEDSIASAATSNGELITFTMPAGALGVASPTRLTLTNYGYGKNAASRFHGGFLLLAQDTPTSEPIVVFDAELIFGGVFTSVADAGQNPRTTNVLRYTPGVTTEVECTTGCGFEMPDSTKLVAIFANIRPSATVAFTVRMRFNSTIYNQYTPLVAIPANATPYPKWYFLGVVAMRGSTNPTAFLNVTAAAASSSLDIDTFVFADLDYTQVLALPGPGDSEINMPVGTVAGATLDIDNKLLSQPAPIVNWSTDTPLPYSGDVALATKDATLTALLLATGGGTGTAGNEWRQAIIATDAVYTNVWTLYRRAAYLVPA